MFIVFLRTVRTRFDNRVHAKIGRLFDETYINRKKKKKQTAYLRGIEREIQISSGKIEN